MPKEVEDCVESVLEDNPDMDESSAYAICHSQQEKLSRREIIQKLIEQKQDDPERICGDFWFNQHTTYADSFGSGDEGRSSDDVPPDAWWEDCVSTIRDSKLTPIVQNLIDQKQFVLRDATESAFKEMAWDLQQRGADVKWDADEKCLVVSDITRDEIDDVTSNKYVNIQ